MRQDNKLTLASKKPSATEAKLRSSPLQAGWGKSPQPYQGGKQRRRLFFQHCLRFKAAQTQKALPVTASWNPSESSRKTSSDPALKTPEIAWKQSNVTKGNSMRKQSHTWNNKWRKCVRTTMTFEGPEVALSPKPQLKNMHLKLQKFNAQKGIPRNTYSK